MKEKEQYQQTLKELITSTFFISLLIAFFVWFVAPWLIEWIDVPIYLSYLGSLGLLIAAGFVYALGYIPHFALYAMKSDGWIVVSHITALIMFFVSLALFKLDNGIETVALALLLAFSCMAMLKLVGCMMNKTDSNFTKVVI
jgi:O-antigen/teichoic acid export membrane protein